MSEPIFERVWDAFTEHLHHGHYHDPDVTPAPEASAMSLATIVAAAEKDAQAIDASAHNFINDHLPALRELAQSVENSELFQVALGLVGTLDPAVEATAVTVLKALAGAPAPAPVAAPVDPAPEPVAAG